MKKQLLTFLFLGLGYLLQAQTTTVSIDPNTRHQEIEGWGTSLCWWANKVGKWTNDTRINEMVDFITSPDGMNMNIFRYNIGGGDNPAHYSTPGNPGHMAHGKGERCEMEGFWPGLDQPFDWTKDAGQINILKKLNDKREDVIFEAFSNSPPYWMTRSGCSSGITDALDIPDFNYFNILRGGNIPSNLKENHESLFCQYLIEVCKHIKEAHGIEFRTLAPFNEPNTIAWYSNPSEKKYLSLITVPPGGTQEGCHFKPAAQMKVIRELYNQLQSSGLNTVISAADETNIAIAVNTINSYVSAGDIMDKIGQINTHSYAAETEGMAQYATLINYTVGSSTDTDRRNLHNLATQHNKRLWQSETGPLNVPGGGLDSHLGVAEIMFSDLKVMKPSAWIDWQFLDTNSDWALVTTGNLNNGNSFTKSKNAYVRMQVTRFIKQGYTMIENGTNNILTAISPAGDELVIVALNNTGAAVDYEYDLSAFGNPLPMNPYYRTSGGEECAINRGTSRNPLPEIVNKAFTHSAPAKSITTYIIPLGANYDEDAIYEGIGFEDEDMEHVTASGAVVVDNPKTLSLNGSNRVLSVAGDIKYSFSSFYKASAEYRYLHVMTYTPDAGGSAQTATGNGTLALAPTGTWTDQVFDLNSSGVLNELNLLIPSGVTSFYIDNLVINNNPNPIQVEAAETAPGYSFEDAAGTPAYQLLTEGEAGTPTIVEISELLGINTTGKALEYTLPATGGSHTLNIVLPSPLRITESTKYLHLMVYAPDGIGIEVGSITANPTFYPNTWQEVVVDLSSLLSSVIWEINLTYQGAESITLIDNIHFSNVAEPTSITAELPDDSPYLIYNRNSQLALAPDAAGTGIMQTTAQEEETGMMWYFKPAGEFYSLVNAKDKKVIAYDNQEILYAESTAGSLFTLKAAQNGYFVIQPQTPDGLAMGIVAGSVDDLAAIALDSYLDGNNYQEFALFKMPKFEDPTNIQGVGTKEIIYSNAVKGELTIYNLSGNSRVEISTLQGITIYQGPAFSNELTLPLPTGIYILKVQDENASYRAKVLVQ